MERRLNPALTKRKDGTTAIELCKRKHLYQFYYLFNIPLLSPAPATTVSSSAAASVLTSAPLPEKKYDVFLSHDWGMDERLRSNHLRVKKLNDFLKKHNIITWFDEDRMKGNIRDTMTEGIEMSKCVLIFVTQKYMMKVGSGNPMDNCYFEFNAAITCLPPLNSSSRIIPIVMEDRMTRQQSWTGRLKTEFGQHLFLNMIEDDLSEFDKSCQEVLHKINEIKALC
jgi:hypothetical protein